MFCGCLAVLADTSALAAESVTVPVDYQGQTIELASVFETPDTPGPYPAVILLHGCRGTLMREYRLPVLVLTGENDDWSWARYCEQHAANLPANAAPFQLHVYSGAYHDFDVNGPEHTVVGHKLAYDAAAAADAKVELLQFLQEYLK